MKKTIADLQAALEVLKPKQEEVWQRYQEGEAQLRPLHDEWLNLYREQQKLEQQIAWLKEMETEAHQ